MARYAIAALLIGLYAGLATWLVQREGHAYRERLQTVPDVSEPATRPPAASSTAPADTLRAAATTKNVATATPSAPYDKLKVSADPPARSADPARGKTHEDVPPPPSAADTKPADAAVAADRVTKGAVHVALAPATGSALTGPKVNTDHTKLQLPEDSFLSLPAMKAVWSVANMTPVEQEQLGRALNEVVLHYNRALDEDPRVQRLHQVAEPLLASRTNKSVNYRFTVLDSDAVNAFSHPGGYVYVSRGMFDIVGEDQDYLLEFVLGHEIAHCELGHAFKCFNDAGVKGLGLGTIQQFYFLIAPLAYPDEQEYEADAWICRQMKRHGCTKRETLGFLRKLDAYAAQHGFRNGRKPPLPRVSSVENHFRAHPAAWERLNRVTAIYDR